MQDTLSQQAIKQSCIFIYIFTQFTTVIWIIASVTHAQASSFKCESTSISDFADDPNYRLEKRQAVKSAQNFKVDTQSGIVKNNNGQVELWHVVERGDGEADAVLMRQKDYKTLPIDEFISIIRWSDPSDYNFHFERSVLDGMVSGVCQKLDKSIKNKDNHITGRSSN